MKRYIKSSENSSTRNYSVSEWDLINDNDGKSPTKQMTLTSFLIIE